jgi:hypothetical protein
MGLLDDAIREHLELKRRSGADPGEVARAEHEALAPIFPAEPVASDEESALLYDDAAEAPQQESPSATAPEQDTAPEEGFAFDGTQDADPSSVGQETVEMDMQAVLDEEIPQPPDTTPIAPVTARPVRAMSAGELDATEWEVSGSSEEAPAPEDIPGQERLSFE